ncbi:hypothetical protein [Krasilnikovia sp. MM14-A1259]|uniref:hypothetical protein n=1 Tax=Krasilnikovia sp. MM14-A1259 TaxID=3373539 RepID=UPI0037FC67AC
MSLMVLTAALLTVNSNDLRQWCSKLEVTAEVEEKDVTVFTSAGWKEVLGGLKSGNVAATLKNSMTAGELDSLLFPLLGTVVPWTAKASNASTSTSNPVYSGSLLVKNWTPISGSPGDVNEASYTWPTSGTITRATS